jgi:hypothetical protein
MRQLSVFLLFIASTTKAQVDDSLQVFHDKAGYITCINNGEYRSIFNKSELQHISFGNREAVYEVKARLLTIIGYQGTSEGHIEIKLLLRDEAPFLEWNNRVARLDTSSDQPLAKSGNLYQTNQIAGIGFSTTFVNGSLQSIEMDLNSGQSLKIGVRKLRGNKSGYFYTISSKSQNGNAGLLLEYSMDGTTPFSLLMISDKTKQSAFLSSKWKWQKFQWLSVKQYSNDALKDNSVVYHLDYDKRGKVKGKKLGFLRVGDCKR